MYRTAKRWGFASCAADSPPLVLESFANCLSIVLDIAGCRSLHRAAFNVFSFMYRAFLRTVKRWSVSICAADSPRIVLESFAKYLNDRYRHRGLLTKAAEPDYQLQ
jgi:hypothetical protein